jgi:hypothetical protein
MDNPYTTPAERQSNEGPAEWGTVKTRLKRVGVLSCGVMLGVMYGLGGFIVGAIITLFTLGGMAANGGGGPGEVLFGIGSIVAIPIVYGIAGFIGGVIAACIYNIVASIAGGIEMEFG